MEKKKHKKPTITIGTDPEFALVDKHRKTITANSFDFFRSSCSTARIGSDGAGVPVEIRPLPAKITEIKIMINDITDIFKRISKWCRKREYTILGGAVANSNRSMHRYMSIGSHIHFGGREFIHPTRFLKGDYESGGRIKKLTEIIVEDNINKLTRCLDTYFTPITNFFIPTQEIYERKKIGYGRLGEYRHQKWGVEYRTPYCFLLSPLLTSGLYSLASLIAYNYKKISPDKNIYKEAVYYYDLMPSNTSKKVQKNIYKKIKPKLLRIMAHNSPNPKLNPAIISLFNLIERNKTCKNKDILSNYSFDEIKVPPFTIYYGRGNSLSEVRRTIEKHITNKTNGEVYLYYKDLGYMNSEIRKIFLSNGMPKIHNSHFPTEVVYEEKRKHGGVKYSIGLSSRIIKDIRTNQTKASFLIKYLNKLELRN